MEQLKIEYLPVDSLKPYSKHARKHSEKDIQAIINSIEEFGFDDPIGIWSNQNIIVEGHGRLIAAKRLGMEKVPCIRLDHLTDEQRNNRFIHQILPYLPQCKDIRGNRTLLTFLLRKVFLDEGLRISVKDISKEYTDEAPRYGNQLDMELGDSYVGNVYSDSVTVYEIRYWSDDDCNEHFLKFTDELMLEHNYIVLYFDNEFDWLVAQEKFGLKEVKDLIPRKKQPTGIGRVINGKDILKWQS